MGDKTLSTTLEWFASIITQPMDMHDTIHPYSPTGQLIAEESKKYIAPSECLQSHQRIELYNQQYWWRLFNVMQKNFPLVCRIFGYMLLIKLWFFPIWWLIHRQVGLSHLLVIDLLNGLKIIIRKKIMILLSTL